MSVITCLRNISDPFLWFVAALLLYPQIPHSQATSCEHRNLELHSDRRLLPNFFIFGLHQVGHSCENIFLISLKFLYSPHDARLIRFVLAFADARSINFDISCVGRNRNFDNHTVRKIGVLKYGPQFDRVLDPIFILEFLYDRSNFERQIDVGGNSIGHHFECTVRGYEGDRPVSVESTESHALMEFYVVDLNTFLLSLTIVLVILSHKQLVVYTEFALRHA